MRQVTIPPTSNKRRSRGSSAVAPPCEAAGSTARMKVNIFFSWRGSPFRPHPQGTAAFPDAVRLRCSRSIGQPPSSGRGQGGISTVLRSLLECTCSVRCCKPRCLLIILRKPCPVSRRRSCPVGILARGKRVSDFLVATRTMFHSVPVATSLEEGKSSALVPLPANDRRRSAMDDADVGSPFSREFELSASRFVGWEVMSRRTLGSCYAITPGGSMWYHDGALDMMVGRNLLYHGGAHAVPAAFRMP